MKKFLKIISIVISLAMLFTFASCKDSNGGAGGKEPGLQYATYKGVLTVTGYVAEKDEDGNVVTSLSASDFKEGVGAIKAGAFSGSQLEEIEIPSSVTSIGQGAFAKMKKLKSLTIPFVGESVDAVNSAHAFVRIFGTESYNGGALISQSYSADATVSAYIPKTLRTVSVIPAEDYAIPAYAFNNLKLVSTINLGENVTEIGDYAFNGAYNVTSITIGEKVTGIGDYAFVGCKALTSVTFEDGALKSIGAHAFENTRVKNIVLPDSVETLGEYCFGSTVANEDDEIKVTDGGSRLESITLSANLKVITKRAFYMNKNLTTVIHGAALEEVGVSAFEGCSALTVFGEDGATDINVDGLKLYDSAFIGIRTGYSGSPVYDGYASEASVFGIA